MNDQRFGVEPKERVKRKSKKFFVESFRGWQKTAINTPTGKVEGI